MQGKTYTGSLVVIAAASGTGKSTVCQQLLAQHPRAKLSVSYTTRPPRQNEQDGVHYHFVTQETFLQMIEDKALLEWASVHGNYYGTGREATETLLKAGHDVLLDIDVQGARTIREEYGSQAVLIFLLPPSWEVMKQRLERRGSETPETIQRRLQTARAELPAAVDFDYLVTNENLDTTTANLITILHAQSMRTYAHLDQLNTLIAQMEAEINA